MIGPSTSGAVAASSKTYFQAGIAHISPSATRTSLTKGDDKEATPGVLPRRAGRLHPGPERRELHDQQAEGRRRSSLFDFQEPYSLGLADAAQSGPEGEGSRHAPAVGAEHDDGLLVVRDAGCPSDADIVFFPTQKPGDAQNFAQQLLEQGKKAKVFGGDGSNDASQFKVPGAYVSNFAPTSPASRPTRRSSPGGRRTTPARPLGSFGPPTYGAVEVALTAIKKACTAGKGQIKDRREVFAPSSRSGSRIGSSAAASASRRSRTTR